jgi:hypothetical protein
MTNTQDGSGAHVDASKYMSLIDVEPLDDENTFGVVHEWERGPTTVTYTDEAPKFRIRANDDLVGDEDSRLFVASEDGELSISYGPQFDATIVTNIRKGVLKRAVSKIRRSGDDLSADFTVHFDHNGPILFESDGITLGATPVRFTWDYPSPDRPKTPTGPSIVGGGGDGE